MNDINTIVQKKKWYKYKWPYFVLVVLLVGGGIAYGQYQKNQEGPQFETVSVKRGTLTQTVDATGNVESASELDLRFETSGKIIRIYKNVGDEVMTGELIMNLDLNELNARVSQYQASVNRAQANLDKLLRGQTTSYLANLMAKRDQAEANLNQIKAQYADSINNAEASVDTALLNLELAEGGENSQIVNNVYEDVFAILVGDAQDALNTGRNEADNILGIDNTLANDEFEDVLSALDSSKLNEAKNKYYLAKSAKNDADTAINKLTFSSSHEEIDRVIDLTGEALFNMKNLLFSVFEVLDNTVPIGDLSQAELEALKTNIQTARATISTQYSALISQKQLISNAKNSYANYKIAYDKAVANLENLKDKRKADLASYQALLDQAEANYYDAKNPPRLEDVASYQASLQEAQASLQQAIAARSRALIMAPVSGVIGKLNSKVGQYVTSQDVVAKFVSPHFEIKVDIPETDIVKISLGNEAQVIFDAYGNDNKFSGTVTEIEKGETIIQDVVYYTVTVFIEEETEKEILNGMTADILFFTAEKNEVLYIPFRTVRSRTDGSRYVRVLENNEIKEVDVMVGLRGDGGLVEIIGGLNENDKVIVSIVE